MAKVRYQMFLEAEQKQNLEKIQRDFKISVAEIIRNAIDSFLSELKVKKKLPVKDDMADKLLSIAGACKGGPKDLSDRHDRYLYGTDRK
ncbi:MAG: hypothetical protein A2073_06325 [Deltaproteobacteria bacterium GWC2_42_11]|nr:MAG: hypothetical protein A2073_06325 [Deltaproteobacteria bacterium GWC2_42_11]HBO84373.1 hypothetical protein [Deltaproteobacteria bacterium]